MDKEVELRRNRARMEAKIAHGNPLFYAIDASNAVEAAMEEALRVDLTPELLGHVPVGSVFIDSDMRRAMVRRLFTAAGLVVIEGEEETA